MRKTTLTWCIVLLLATSLQVACKKGPSEQELKLVDLQGQLTAIEQNAKLIEQQRSDLAAAQQDLADIEAIAENKRSDEQNEMYATLPGSIQELGAAKDATFEELQGQLADFLNIALNEFPESEQTKEGLRLYSEEAIRIATDMIDKAGDYKKAIDNLQAAKNYYDAVNLPVYQPILDKIAEFDEWRYITEERFQQIQKKMTRDEVKAIAGVPYYGNIQEDQKQGVETWLYRKREGGAAAVYFKMKTGTVYGTKFDAIQAKVVTDDDSEQ